MKIRWLFISCCQKAKAQRLSVPDPAEAGCSRWVDGKFMIFLIWLQAVALDIQHLLGCSGEESQPELNELRQGKSLCFVGMLGTNKENSKKNKIKSQSKSLWLNGKDVPKSGRAVLSPPAIPKALQLPSLRDAALPFPEWNNLVQL